MNILFVTPRIPYPLDSGAKIRTFHLLSGLHARHSVVLLSFVYNENDARGASALEEMGIKVVQIQAEDRLTPRAVVHSLADRIPLNIAKYYSTAMRRAINSLVNEERIDAVHFDHIHMGQYVDMCECGYTVIDEHNVEALIMKRLYRTERNIIKRAVYKREYKRLMTLERDKCRKASRVTVVSEEDGALLRELCGDTVHVEVVPNGVDTQYFAPITRNPDGSGEAETMKSAGAASTPDFLRTTRYALRGMSTDFSLVYTGAMDWLPNSDAAEYMIKDILPLIWRKKKDATFYIVGKNPPRSLQRLARADERIVVTGNVPDVRPYVHASKVFVVPLRIGGGTRLKILEALSMKKAVVSTSVGSEGLSVRDGEHILIADDPNIFADRVLRLLDDDAKRQGLGEQGRALIKKTYNWGSITRRLTRLYEKEHLCQPTS